MTVPIILVGASNELWPVLELGMGLLVIVPAPSGPVPGASSAAERSEVQTSRRSDVQTFSPRSSASEANSSQASSA